MGIVLLDDPMVGILIVVVEEVEMAVAPFTLHRPFSDINRGSEGGADGTPPRTDSDRLGDEIGEDDTGQLLKCQQD